MRAADAADTLGADGRFFDPLWRVDVALTDLERELLRTWHVRRLAFIAHAGAASITTTQRYSRLEHSLGVLALVAHFAPDDHAARVTALLHDVGHLAFSHSIEGFAGLNHHAIGRVRIRSLDPVLREHGLDAETVIALDEGRVPSPLFAVTGGLKLDHLDSFVRSGQAHGRTVSQPWELLRRLRLRGGTVDADAATAAELVDLIVGEARGHRASANVSAVAVLRSLVSELLTDAPGELLDGFAGWTDDELWAALLADPRTAERTRAFRRSPDAWRALLRPADAVPGPAQIEHVIARGYLDLPMVDGELRGSAEVLELRAGLPLRYLVEPY